MLQARQLGDELLVGVHSDKAILENKGPTVMRLDERFESYRTWQYVGLTPTGSWQSKPAAG
jgi:cytidyltransferase-like protein